MLGGTEQLGGQLVGDHAHAVEGALQRLAVQLDSHLVGCLLQQVNEGHVVGEDDHLPTIGLLREPLGEVGAALVV